MSRQTEPPRFEKLLLTMSLHRDDRDCALSDLAEEFDSRATRDGVVAARRWYRGQVIRSIWPSLWRRLIVGPTTSPRPGGRFFGPMLQDLRFGVRLIRRSPAFSVTAAVVLSLGIGVNTALFSIVSALFFRDLHVKAQDDLFFMYRENFGDRRVMPLFRGPLSQSDVLGLMNPVLADYSATWGITAATTVGDETTAAAGEYVEGNYFDLLGVSPWLGRTLQREDNLPSNTDHAIVVSHDFFVRRLHADSSQLGTLIRVKTMFYRLVGVAPPGFRGLSDPWKPSQFWIPSAHTETGVPIAAQLFGRLKPNVTLAQLESFLRAQAPVARAETMRRFSPELRERHKDWAKSAQFPVYRLGDVAFPAFPENKLIASSALAALVAVVLLVLMIAATNIAGLLMARGVTRAPEIAMRRALGAAGHRLVRQLLTETILMSVIAGALGGFVAWTLVAIFRTVTPPSYSVEVDLNLRVFLFATLTCLIAGVLVGLAPALQAARVNVLETLGAGGSGSRQVRAWLRHWIVVPQIALSLVLLVIAAIHVRALSSIELSDLGYQTDQALTLRVNRWEWTPPYGSGGDDAQRLQEEAAAKLRTFTRNVIARVGGVPGIGAFALTDQLPLQASVSDLKPVISQQGQLSGQQQRVSALRGVVSGGFFDALGMRLIRGRTFDDRDGLDATKVAVISESLEKQLWPGGTALGQRIAFESASASQKPEWLEVIGVVNEVDPVLGDVGDRPAVYASLMQQWRGWAPLLVVRGSGDQAALIKSVKTAVLGADVFAEVTQVRTLRQAVDEILYPRRVAAAILATAGVLGLALACTGLYGVISYSVAQRRREIGIRSTLGANRKDILALVLREGAAVTAWGTATGGVLTFVALRVSANAMPGVPVIDLVSFLTVPTILVVVAIAAAIVPARRAASTDPSQILRG